MHCGAEPLDPVFEVFELDDWVELDSAFGVDEGEGDGLPVGVGLGVGVGVGVGVGSGLLIST